MAEHLARQGGEGFYRSAVSRAYYGVFGHIRETLEQVTDRRFSRGRDVHRGVANALRNDSRPAALEVADALNELRQERNVADYQTLVRFDVDRARDAISMARNIQNRFVALFP